MNTNKVSREKSSLRQGVEVHSTHCESEKRGEIQKNHPCATIHVSQA